MMSGAILNFNHVGSERLLTIVALCIIIGPMLASRLRVPAMIGLVLAGTLVGPYVLHWLHYAELDGLGNIGLLYLMFQAGLELDLNTFEKNRKAALVFGVLTFSFPLLIGGSEGLWLGLAPGAALLLGSIWASHTLVTLPDVKQAGLASNRAVTATAGATVLTDTLALCVLAVVASIARGGGPTRVLLSLALGLGLLIAYSMFGLPRIASRFFTGSGQTRSARFTFLLFALASAALLAALFGVEGLIGAFLAGLGLNRLVPNESELMERVEFFGSALLVPAFLIYVGTKLDPSVVARASTLILALEFIAALLLGKGLAAVVAARSLKMSWAEAGVMFGMSVPQAAATLAATLVGYDVGLFTDQIVNAVVVVVLVSLFVGSVATRAFAHRVDTSTDARPEVGERVLAAVRGEAGTPQLMQLAVALTRPDAGTVTPLAISGRSTSQVAQAREVLSRAEESATAAGADVEGKVRTSASFAEGVHLAVIEDAPTAVLLNFTDRLTLSARALGTELDAIGHGLYVPIVATRFSELPPTRILLALDVRQHSGGRTLDAMLATTVARRYAAALEVPLDILITRRTDSAHLGIDTTAEGVSVTVKEGSLRPDDLQLTPGTVLVLTPARFRGLSFALQRRLNGVSVIVAASAGRMRITSAPRQSGDFLGLQTFSGGSTRTH